MARRCPHCTARITYVKYDCNTRGWQTGTVDEAGDWETDDSGTDDEDNYTYRCPECEHAIQDGSNWIQEEPDEEPEEDTFTVHPVARATTSSGWCNFQ